MKARNVINLIDKIRETPITEDRAIIGKVVTQNDKNSILSTFNKLGLDKFIDLLHKTLVDASEEDGPGGLETILKSKPKTEHTSSEISIYYESKGELKEDLDIILSLRDGGLSFNYGTWFVTEQGRDPTHGDKTEEFQSDTIKIFDGSNLRKLLVRVLKEIYFSKEADRFRDLFNNPPPEDDQRDYGDD